MIEETWVINASPPILLGKLGRTDLLEQLAKQIMVPQAVLREVASGRAADAGMGDTLAWARNRVVEDIFVPISISGWRRSSVEKTRMSEPDSLSRAVIPEHLMLSRLAQSEQMREFFIRMWLQNPALARQGGIKVQNLLSPLAAANAVISPDSPSGFTADIEGSEK